MATRVPLIIHIPGVTEEAETNNKFSLIDPLEEKKNFHKSERKPIDNTSILRDELKKSGTNYPMRYSQRLKSPTTRIKDPLFLAGYSTNQPVELVDMFPTLAELAGLKVPPTCPENPLKDDFCTEGSSLAPLIYNVTGRNHGLRKIVRWKNATFSQYPRPSDLPTEDSDIPHLVNITIMGYSMRTENYRYTEWIGFDHVAFKGNWKDVHAREFYVLQNDAHEDFNMVDDPKYASVVKHLSQTLQSGWRYSLPVFT